MRIYFATASDSNSQIQRKMINEIQRYGHVLCPWKITDSVMTNVTRYPDRQIHDQSVRQLEIADVLIAEVSPPSLGVGYELGLAEQLDMPNLILYNPAQARVSPIINGARKFNVKSYHDWHQAKSNVDNFLNQFKP